MSDYIKREGAEQVLVDFINKSANPVTLNDVVNLLGKIHSLPAADVVEVVRCIDCELWKSYNGYDGDKGLGWCNDGCGNTTHALFYCGGGMRRDQAKEE